VDRSSAGLELAQQPRGGHHHPPLRASRRRPGGLALTGHQGTAARAPSPIFPAPAALPISRPCNPTSPTTTSPSLPICSKAPSMTPAIRSRHGLRNCARSWRSSDQSRRASPCRPRGFMRHRREGGIGHGVRCGTFCDALARFGSRCATSWALLAVSLGLSCCFGMHCPCCHQGDQWAFMMAHRSGKLN